MAGNRQNDLEEEMSRFEQEIAGQLPPPPRPPMTGRFAAVEDDTEIGRHGDFRHENASGVDHSNQMSSYSQNDHQQMLHPFPQLPHLPPLPPLPHGLPMPPSLGNRSAPSNMPQFIPPPLPPMMLNPVSVSKQSAPIIKPPTVPIDNYDPSEALEEKNVDAGSSGASVEGGEKTKSDRKRKFVRVGGGQTWEDDSLTEWDANDFRLFCGDLGNEVTDEYLYRAFAGYSSIVKAKVVRDKKTKKTKGYGFISFKDPQDYLKAMREMNGRYVGNRPIKLRKSTWKDRNIEVARKKDKEKKRLGLR